MAAPAKKTEAKDVVGEVILTDVRLSFAELFKRGKPRKNDKGEEVEGKFHCNLLMDKKDPNTAVNLAKLKKASAQVKAKKWGADEKKWPKLKADRVFLRDGNQEDWDGYEGQWYVSANNPEQPVLVDRVKDEDTGKLKVLTLQNGGPKRLYSGAYVNAIVRIWAQDSAEYGKRLNCSIESVQYLRKGDPFSGAAPVDPNEKFAALPDDDEDDENLIGHDGDEEDEDADSLV